MSGRYRETRDRAIALFPSVAASFEWTFRVGRETRLSLLSLSGMSGRVEEREGERAVIISPEHKLPKSFTTMYKM